MTEPSNEPVGATQDAGVETIEIPLPSAGDPTPAQPEGDQGAAGWQKLAEMTGEPDLEQYPKSYVEKLREENAANRIAAKDADKVRERLMQASIEAATAGVLWDPTDLAASDDFLGEDGLPDLHKIKDAAEELASRKPHLSRPRGSAGQGASPAPDAGPGLHDMLRAAAR